MDGELPGEAEDLLRVVLRAVRARRSQESLTEENEINSSLNTSETEVFDEDISEDLSAHNEEEDEEEDQELNMASNMTDAEVDAVRDAAELQRLLKAQLALNKNPAAGGGGRSGVLWKGEPPSLDESEDYGVWKKKLKVWQMATGLDNKQQAAAVIQGISDDHKYHKKGLLSLLMGTLSDGEIDSLTMERVIQFLDGQLLGSTEEKTFGAYVDFIDCVIKPGEKYENFIIRFETLYQKLVKRDNDITIPGKILAMQVMRAAKLPQAWLISVRANVKWDEDEVYENTKKAINRICHGEINKPSGSAQVKLTTDEGAFEIKREGGCFIINEEKLYTAAEAEMYLTGGRGRGNGKGGGRTQRGRGGPADRGGGRGDKSAKELTCWTCGKPGHKAAKCKETKLFDERENEEGHYIGEFWMTEAEQEPDNLDEFIEIDELEELVNCEEEDGEQECHVDVNATETGSFRAEAEAAAGLDSCCSRTIMGKGWLSDYKKEAPYFMKKDIKGPEPSNVTFTFGNGGKMRSNGRYQLPVMIHGKLIRLAVELVSSDIPLLLSKSTMQKCGIVLDFSQNKITAFGRTENLRSTTIGHPIIRVLPRGNEPLAGEVVAEMLEDEKEGKCYHITEIKNKKLTVQEQRDWIRKVHKQAGHQSKKKFREFLELAKVDWDKKVLKEELDNLARNCHGCIMKKRTPDKPAACIPVSFGFNQCVGVDLKINSDGTIILYIIDMWSKLLQARLVKSKRSEEIVGAILDCWVSVYGAFERTIHDNGGEFTGKPFKEMMDLLGVSDGTSGAHSPWSCGVVEKHHSVVDSTYQALLRDFPRYKKETLLQWAVFVKNSTTTTTGWSPYQIVFGRNPKVPDNMNSNIAGLREEVVSKEMLENLNSLEQARVEFNRALCDARLKKMLKSKVRRNQTVFEAGHKVFWRAHNNIENWRQGKVLAVDGKVMWVRDGSEIYRVSTDMAVKVNEEYDKNGVLVDQQQAKIVSSIKKRKKRLGSYEEIPEQEPASQPVERGPEAREDGARTPTAPPSQGYDNAHPVLNGLGGARVQVGTSNDIAAANPVMPEVHCPDVPDEREEGDHHLPCQTNSMTERSRAGLAGPGPTVSSQLTDSQPTNHPPSEAETPQTDNNIEEDEVFEPEVESSNQQENIDPQQLRRDVWEAKQAEAEERRGRKRRSEDTPAPTRGRKFSRSNKQQHREPVKRGDVIFHGEKVCDVGARAGRVTGKYVNTFNLYPKDGTEPYSVDLSKVEYRKLGEEERMEINIAEDECHMSMVPYQLHGNLESREAKREELHKIVNKYKAVEVVDDVGQVRISTKFVLWYKKASDGSVKTRARLVARGFEELQKVDSDSPTLDATSVKIIMAYARAKNMKVVSADVRAAFLQGLPLTERTVYVQPPKEAELGENKIWRLKVSLYGLQDASLRFHWKVRAVFKEMGLIQSKLDPAVFYQKNKAGEVVGIIGSHVDDFIIAGSSDWTEAMIKKIGDKFELGTVEKNNFLYCGHRVMQDQDGNLQLSQEEYASEVKEFHIKPERKKQNQEPVTETERKLMRAYAGKIGWLSRLSRPDLTFAQIEASSAITRATVADLKQLQKAVTRVKEEKNIVEIPKLPARVEDWKLSTYTDAAWQNLNGEGSTGGRAMFLSGAGKTFAVHWAAHRMRRVCHSSQSAEIMALNEGLNDAAYIRTMIHEISGVWIDGEIVTDCKNAYMALIKTTAPTDKRVKCEAAAVREALMEGEVKRIKLVRGSHQLADVLTKRKVNPQDFLQIVQTGVGLAELGY